MDKGRLEAFSDGVIAIIITIMVLEIKVPHGEQFEDLKPMIPVFLSYLLSFIYVGIYWNNHHHLLKSAEKVNGKVLWANLHLLLWLSLFPFVTAWAGENHLSTAPVALYGFVLLMAALSWWILQYYLLKANRKDSILAKAIIGHHLKERLSPILYFAGLISAFWIPAVSVVMYVIVALLWLIPDKRIERNL